MDEPEGRKIKHPRIKQVCHFFNSGKRGCKNAGNCNFAHVNMDRNLQNTICMDYLIGKCAKGDKCSGTHVLDVREAQDPNGKGDGKKVKLTPAGRNYPKEENTPKDGYQRYERGEPARKWENENRYDHDKRRGEPRNQWRREDHATHDKGHRKGYSKGTSTRKDNISQPFSIFGSTKKDNHEGRDRRANDGDAHNQNKARERGYRNRDAKDDDRYQAQRARWEAKRDEAFDMRRWQPEDKGRR